MASLTDSGVWRGVVLVTLLMAAGGARADTELDSPQADDVELDAPHAEAAPHADRSGEDNLWNTPFQRVVWLTAQGTLASTAALVLGALLVGLPWYGLFGLSTLWLLSTQNSSFYYPCCCLTLTPLAGACGSLGAYVTARAVVPYVAYIPQAERLGSRLMFGLASNLVDVSVHAAALAVALLVFTLLAGVVAAVGVASAVSLGLMPGFQTGNAGAIIFVIFFYGALSMAVPTALAGVLLVLPPALLAAQLISPSVGLLANQRLQALADGSAPEPEAASDE